MNSGLDPWLWLVLQEDSALSTYGAVEAGLAGAWPPAQFQLPLPGRESVCRDPGSAPGPPQDSEGGQGHGGRVKQGLGEWWGSPECLCPTSCPVGSRLLGARMGVCVGGGPLCTCLVGSIFVTEGDGLRGGWAFFEVPWWQDR